MGVQSRKAPRPDIGPHLLWLLSAVAIAIALLSAICYLLLSGATSCYMLYFYIRYLIYICRVYPLWGSGLNGVGLCL